MAGSSLSFILSLLKWRRKGRFYINAHLLKKKPTLFRTRVFNLHQSQGCLRIPEIYAEFCVWMFFSRFLLYSQKGCWSTERLDLQILEGNSLKTLVVPIKKESYSQGRPLTQIGCFQERGHSWVLLGCFNNELQSQGILEVNGALEGEMGKAVLQLPHLCMLTSEAFSTLSFS